MAQGTRSITPHSTAVLQRDFQDGQHVVDRLGRPPAERRLHLLNIFGGDRVQRLVADHAEPDAPAEWSPSTRSRSASVDSPSRSRPGTACENSASVGTGFTSTFWRAGLPLITSSRSRASAQRNTAVLPGHRRLLPFSNDGAIWELHSDVHLPLVTALVLPQLHAHRLYSCGDGARLWSRKSSRSAERTSTRLPIRVTPGNSPRSIIA